MEKKYSLFKKEKTFIILLIFVFFTAIPLFSQINGKPAQKGISLSKMISSANFTFRWFPVLDSGELKYGDDTFSFKVGSDFIVYNYKEKINGCSIRREGHQIILDKKTEEIIMKKAGFRDREVVLKTEKDNKPRTISQGHRIAAILIDPGHGGRDPGAIGRHVIDGKKFSINEKDVALDIALELNKMLISTYRDKKILLTRKSDTYPSLEDRVEQANNVKLKGNEAMVFISIHANASFNKKAKGFEVWYLPPDYRRDLLDPETIDSKHKDVIPILNTMLEEEITMESVLLAQNILNSMNNKLGNETINRGLKEETWFVVRNAKMPSVLIEVGFVSNQEEALKLSRKEYLKKITNGIYNGIKNFIENIETVNIAGE